MAISQELAILTARAQKAELQADELRQKADERQGSILDRWVHRARKIAGELSAAVGEPHGPASPVR